jgi:glycosyltransferase involved in cell wall biosynthesis
MERPKLIYITPGFSSFVKKDIAFLSEKAEVIAPVHDWTTKLFVPFSLLRQLLFLIRHLPGSKAVFVMFGGYWALLPSIMGRILRKPVYIIPGGTDCVSFPSLGYGSLRKPLLRTVIKWSYRLSTRLLPVDESLVFSNYTYLETRDYDFQGYRYFFPSLKTDYTVIHNGYIGNQFEYNPEKKERNSFITIAAVDDMRRFRIKGIDSLLTLAAQFPKCTFRVIGISETFKLSLPLIPTNLILFPFLEAKEFTSYLNISEFCIQLSISEGFPSALCEAMLGGCIPIVSSVGAMPKIVDKTGFIMESSAPSYLKQKFEEILTTEPLLRLDMAAGARGRVIDNFSIEKRKEAFSA